MKKLPEILEIYLYDFEYQRLVELLSEDFKASSPSYSFKDEVREGLESFIESGNAKIKAYFVENTMGIGAWPEDIAPNSPDAHQKLFKRIYTDLYSDDPQFKKNLIKIEVIRNNSL